MTHPTTKQINLILAQLVTDQEAIVYESSEDEGAMEHHAEIGSIIDVCENNSPTWDNINEAAANVGHREDFIKSIMNEAAKPIKPNNPPPPPRPKFNNFKSGPETDNQVNNAGMIVENTSPELDNLLEEYHITGRRNKQVSYLLTLGMRNDQIADTLELNRQTVKQYVTQVMAKLGTYDRVELVNLLQSYQEAGDES